MTDNTGNTGAGKAFKETGNANQIPDAAKNNAVIEYINKNKNVLLVCTGAVVAGGTVATFGFAKVLGVALAAGIGALAVGVALEDDKDTPSNE